VRVLRQIYHDMQYAQEGHSPDNSTTQAAELRHQVRRLSHHPSIVLWDGCNEVGLHALAASLHPDAIADDGAVPSDYRHPHRHLRVVRACRRAGMRACMSRPAVLCHSSPLRPLFAALRGRFVMTVVAEEDQSRAMMPSCPSVGWSSGVNRLTGASHTHALSRTHFRSAVTRALLLRGPAAQRARTALLWVWSRACSPPTRCRLRPTVRTASGPPGALHWPS
jgi:hypothetical protein